VTLTYTGSELTGITDAFGRGITLAYSGGRIATISAGGRTTTYSYSSGNLERVDHPDGQATVYEYTDPADVHNLTAVIDANNHVVESHAYTADRVTHSVSEDGNDELDLEYDTPATDQTRVTNSRGQATVYTHDPFSGLATNITGPGCSSCGGGGVTTDFEYDDWLRRTAIERAITLSGTTPSTIRTEMTHDVYGNLLTQTENATYAGSAPAFTTEYTYDASSFNFPRTIRTPTVHGCGWGDNRKVVTNVYDEGYPVPKGDVTTRRSTGAWPCRARRAVRLLKARRGSSSCTRRSSSTTRMGRSRRSTGRARMSRT
jgi:YD repeat-containing protein